MVVDDVGLDKFQLRGRLFVLRDRWDISNTTAVDSRHSGIERDILRPKNSPDNCNFTFFPWSLDGLWKKQASRTYICGMIAVRGFAQSLLLFCCWFCRGGATLLLLWE